MNEYIEEMEVSTNKCHTCAYFNPKYWYCSRYLRGVETAAYLCSFCRTDGENEMETVSEMEMAYAESLND